MIAVTRPKERADETIELVRKRGWKAFIVPTIEIVPRQIDPSIKLEDFDWLVVTSASGVDVLWRHFNENLKKIDIAVVGPKTKAAFERKGVYPKVVAEEHVGEGLARELKGSAKGKKLLVARAAIGRKEFVEELETFAHVTELALYDTVFPKDDREIKRFKELLNENNVGALVITSSEAAKNLFNFLGKDGLKKLNEIIVCPIGPITAKTVERYGVKVTCMPRDYTLDAALEEISKHRTKL